MTKTVSIIIYFICIYLIIILIMFIFQRSLLYLPSKEKLSTTYYSNTELEKVEDEKEALRVTADKACDAATKAKSDLEEVNEKGAKNKETAEIDPNNPSIPSM